MPIKKIIFFLEQPFDSRNYDRFGIEIFQRNGFEVLVCDFTPFRFPGRRGEETVCELTPSVRVEAFQAEEDALAAISQIERGAFVICLLGYSWQTYPIYEALSALEIPYAVFTMNALPSSASRRAAFAHRIKRLIRPDRQTLSQSVIQAARNFLYRRKAGKLRGATFWLAGGTESPTAYFYPTDKDTRVLWLHSLDYDLYLNEKDRPFEASQRAVFLDQYLPFHADFLSENRNAPVSPQRYYSQLNKLFDHLEGSVGLKTDIAAHPRSAGDGAYRGYFGDRPVLYGQTAGLIRRSVLVIAHYTTAVNLAVLFRKPIAFVTTEELQASDCGPQIETHAGWLGKSVINLDKDLGDVDWDRELTVDERSYENYKRCYISTSQAPAEAPSWQILADALKQMA